MEIEGKGSKVPISSLSMYKETRISFEPPARSSTIHLQLPSANAFTRSTTVSRKVITSLQACPNEEQFKRRHVASESSIFFRHSSRYPHAILWRCLEKNGVLELRSIDTSKQHKDTRSASLIIRLAFPHPIRTGGVALADSSGEDALNVFVATKGNDLYTFTLRPIFFCDATATGDDMDRWCKVFRPSSLSVSNAHKLVATRSRELLVTLGDGKIARLHRQKGSDGSHWTESVYNNGHWMTAFKGYVPWYGSNSIRYGDTVLDQNTAIAASTSPDAEHIFAVTANHTLKAWNIKSGMQSFARDLLDIQREPKDAAKVMLDPGIANPLQLFISHSSAGYKYCALTFSPLESGLFKFWGIRDADTNENGVVSLFEDQDLKLPDPDDGALWSLADFQVKADPTTSEIELWIMLRLNRRYKLYFRKFPELANIDEDWEFGWVVTSIDSAGAEPMNQPPITISELDCEDISSKWLNYLFTPHRVPAAVLEASLSTYTQTRDLTIPAKLAKASLREQLATVIGSGIQLKHQRGTPQQSFTSFRQEVLAEWNNFWNIVTDIDHVRWEPLSLCFDHQSNIPWIVLTDGCSAIRGCSEIEVLAENNPKDVVGNPRALVLSIESAQGPAATRSSEELAKVIDAAAKFRATFSEDLRVSIKNTLAEELWTDASYSVSTRIQLFYDSCNFATEVNDRQYKDLTNSLRDLNMSNSLSTDTFFAIIETLAAPSSRPSGLVSTAFGKRALVRGAQDMIALHSRVLLDLLYLVVFLDVEPDQDEYSIDNFDAEPLYIALLDGLRVMQLSEWLATSVMPDLQPEETASSTGTGSNTVKQVIESFSTVLERNFVGDIELQSSRNQSQSTAFTQTIRNLLTWISGNGEIALDGVLVTIQCNLLRQNNLKLAASLQQFQPSTGWATYIRGRLCLAKQEYTEAAIYFRKAAFSMARKDEKLSYSYISNDYIDPISAQLLGSGLANYHDHIVCLFAPLRAHTIVTSFARLALQHCSPTSAPEQYSDLLARLFHASLATSSFQAAYAALARYTDRALQRSALSSLLKALAEHDAIDELLRLPFPTLQKEVDSWLVEKARAESTIQPRAGVTPYFKILYAWRLRQGDFRGAAAVLVERLEAKRRSKGGRGSWGGSFKGGKGEAEQALDEYLVGINALALVGGKEDGWVFVDGEGGKRKVVRLEDLRSAYDKEMDRVGMLELGRFGIVDGDDDVEMDG